MSVTRPRPSLFSRVTLPCAFALALGCLVVEVLAPFALASGVELAGLVAGPFVLLVAALASLALALSSRSSRHDPARAAQLRREASIVSCVLAPLAVLSPWTIAPTHLGPAYASFPFFLAWLTRYPTIGAINHEVLLGIGALLGACAMPVALAAYVVWTARPRPRVLAVLAMLQLVAYVPVLVRLDADTLGYAWMVAREGPITLFGPVEGAWWQNALAGLTIGAGALLRLGATATMLAWVPLSLRAKEPLLVWET